VPTAGVDFVVHEFFVARSFRGRGVASWAAQRGIRNHRGAWEVVTYPSAARPIAFWRKTLPACTDGDVVETEEDHPWGRKVVFRFDTA
jgi:predicted acetyltransferase